MYFFLIPFSVVVFWFLTLFGIEYYCHVKFTKERVANEESATLSKGQFAIFRILFEYHEWTKLTEDLLLAADCLGDRSCLSQWIVSLDREHLIFGPIDFIRYRLFLMSDKVKSIRYSKGWGRHA